MVSRHKFLFFSSNAVVFSCCRLFLVPFIPLLKIRIGLGWECGLHSSACSGSTCLNWILCLKLSKPGFSVSLAAIHLRRRTLATLPVTSLQLVMVNVLELDVLFDVELLDFGGAQSISRTSHCTFDLGNLRILNCTYSRVVSFPSVILFLRGIFHERRHLVEIHLQIMYRFFAGLSAELMRTAWKNFNSSVSTSCVSNLTMVYFYPLFDLVVRRHQLSPII